MNKVKPVILILGMPGSGKTTIGQKLASYLHLPFRSVGDILRAGPPICSADPAMELLSLHLQTELFPNGLVLDYSPVRSDGEEQLHKTLNSQSFAVSFVVYVQVKKRDAEKRFSNRGPRVGDPEIDMKQFFKRRIATEFWPFTLPMVKKAYRGQNLIILDNRMENPGG